MSTPQATRFLQAHPRRAGQLEFSRMNSLRLAAPTGFEPVAYRLGGGRSILLSYGAAGLYIQ